MSDFGLVEGTVTAPLQKPRYSVSAGGEWPSLEARAEHIAGLSSVKAPNTDTVRWKKIYDVALAHLRAVAK